MERGQMDSTDSNKIDRNYDKFEKTLEPKYIMAKLMALGVIDQDDIDAVESQQERVSRVSTFMKIIKNRGRNAYPKFIEALKDAKYESLVGALEPTYVNNKPENPEVPEGADNGPPREEIPQ